MYDKDTIQNLLYRSLDAALTSEEEKQLELGLAQYPEIVEERNQLMRLRSSLRSFTVSATPSGFSESLRQKINQPRVIQLQSWAPQIVAACLVITLAFVLGLYFNAGTLSTEVVLGVEELSPEDAYTLLTY
jgi:hypothetical protein